MGFAVGFQSYGHQLDIEAGKITMAAGGGEGGFGVRVVDGGRFGFAHLVDVSGAQRAVEQAVAIAQKSPSIKGFVLPSEQPAQQVGGRMDTSLLDLSPEDLLEQADTVLSAVHSLDERAVVTGGGCWHFRYRRLHDEQRRRAVNRHDDIPRPRPSGDARRGR